MKIAVIVKTHDDQRVLDLCVESLKKQTRPADWIAIMDSGSRDIAYLRKHVEDKSLDVIVEKQDVGFCVGNNIAARRYIDRAQLIFFLNPDAFLPAGFLEELAACAARLSADKIGVIGPKLRRFDLTGRMPTARLDSTGIFRNWHGKWYDRGQGEIDDGRYDRKSLEPVPAICGAAMICGAQALKTSQLREGEYFRESFFMYKDDIELSVRIRKNNYPVLYASSLMAYHCRGWQSRRKMPKKYKLMSAQNEIFVNSDAGWVPRLYSALKLLAVRLGY